MILIENYNNIVNLIKSCDGTLVAVSKFKSVNDIQELYNLGHRDFGENYVQELITKKSNLPEDIKWHFIGHLQRNKVKEIAPFIHLIQSLDSFKLLLEINKEAKKNNRVIDVLIQVYLGDESTKFGLDEKETLELLEYYDAQIQNLQNVRIVGLMGMATLTDKIEIVKKEFKKMNDLFHIVKTQYFLGQSSFNILSMGMSGDYKQAIECGSNMLRIGSKIFGERF